MDLSTLLNHPDVDNIVSKLLAGVSPAKIADSLRLQYSKPEQSHLLLSVKLLKDFQSSEYLDYYKQVEKDLGTVKNGDKLSKKIANSLLNNKTYQERLQEIADEKIDAAKLFKSIQVILLSRIEQIFDKIQEDPGFVKKDTEGSLIKYLEQAMNFIEKHEKVINNKPDHIVQHNYVITYLNQYTSAMQNAILETLQEIDQEAASLFMEKFAEKTKDLKNPTEMAMLDGPPPTEKSLIKEAKQLKEMIQTEL